MEKRNGLRHSDGMIVLVCVTLALMTLGSVGQTGRGRAKEVVCQANLHRWGDIFGGIVEENGGKFLTGATYNGYWWPIQLPHEYQDWRRNRAWFCPMATVPTLDEHGTMLPIPSIFSAWGVYTMSSPMSYEGKLYTMHPNGLSGSYGLNGYTLNVKGTYESGVPASQGWGDLLSVPDAGRVPMFSDALRFDLWPQDSQGPAMQEFAAWSSNNMARCCINRHDGAVNCLFVDGSVRKVGLKELWTLKWHRSFNTDGPWTKAGGVQSENWPEWIRPFKDY
ncbi:MAG TPA: H-X9-DG-CTERM domain-containing protein [Sedimentisphaerales bacterium]|nr:H-X9-DG-CTERM domain-containing protein [Sedimentisphaerales bacterium]